MPAQHEPNPSAAPVQKVRLRYTKRGRLRFTSHRDVARAFERALRRAGVPMAYSQGFHPHPKVSWVGAAPTGVASEAEYVEIALVRELDPELVGREIDAALPPGLDVVDAVTAGPGSLSERMHASQWQIVVDGVSPQTLQAAVEAFMAVSTATVTRLTKDGRRELDARGPVIRMGVPLAGRTEDCPACGILDAVVAQVSPAVRPDDVMSALLVVAGLELPVPIRATRMAQGPLDDDGVLGDPLAVDRQTSPARAGAPGATGTARR